MSNWYDYGARFYDPMLGRWHSMDALSEAVFQLTPYRYGLNNPIKYKDFGGFFELPSSGEYTVLARYLEYGISKLLSNNKVMYGLAAFGNLDINTIVNDFKWGEGPKIIIESNDYAHGWYKKSTPNTIYLDKGLVEKLQNASSSELDAYLLWVISTLLHEYVHYGEYTSDGVDNGNGEGVGFEKFVYGMDIQTLNDAQKLIDMYLERVEKSENSSNEENNSENDRKASETATFLSNFQNLDEGTYIWNGSQWVLE